MVSRRLRSVAADERGIALPLALIMLMLLTSLTIAFLTMSASEPTIAANLKGGEMALAAAEAGIERAIWALQNPTIDTAGANTKLTDFNAIPAAYNAGTLFALDAARAYTVQLVLVNPTTVRIIGHGYVAREGVALPANPGGLAQADTAAHRTVQLEVTAAGGGGNRVGGSAAGTTGGDVTLPGALTVAGSVQMRGNSLVDGNDSAPGVPNGCANKAGVTIRDQTPIPDNQCGSPPCYTNNAVTFNGNAYSLTGTPANQTLTSSNFSQYTFNATQLAALKALAQASGTYIQPTSSSQMQVSLGNGLTFVDTVNGQAIGQFPTSSQLANVKITGNQTASGWLVVMGSIEIDGNITYNGFIYAHNDLSYRGTGTGGIFGGVLTGNVIDTVATLVDAETEGNSKIYYDCNGIANGGGAFTPDVQAGLNRVIITVNAGTWRELSN